MGAREDADHGLAILDALADVWAEETDLTSMIKSATSPFDLVRSAPQEVRRKFRLRMEAQIDAMIRHAFKAGAYRAITGLQDEREQMQRSGLRPDDLA